MIRIKTAFKAFIDHMKALTVVCTVCMPKMSLAANNHAGKVSDHGLISSYDKGREKTKAAFFQGISQTPTLYISTPT